jgi:hypothetical protein
VDLDRDGLLDLALATETEGRIYVWDLATADAEAAAPWPMAQGSPSRAGRWSPSPVSLSPTPAPSETRSRVIDPDNPLTQISFNLAREQLVRLSIVDLMGQTVRRLLDYRLPPGRYSIVWDGDDDDGQPQPAGVYFYDLRIGDSSASQQMLLLK